VTATEAGNGICASCGGTSLQIERRYRTKTSHGKAIFRNSWLRQCNRCGLVQAIPSPTLGELTNYYAVDYRKNCCAGADVADISKFPHDNFYYYNRGQSIAELLCQHLTSAPERILDIGAGYGHILYALGQRFPSAKREAIELSQVCVQYLRASGIIVHAKPAEEAFPQMEGYVDLIVISHVFEHLLNPHKMLRLIHQRLAPGGLLYIEVPHIPPGAENRYIDNIWAPRYDEPHITFFSQQPLTTLLEAGGFDVLFCDTAGQTYKRISALQFYMPHWRWFLQKLIPPAVFHFLRRQRFTNALKVKEREESFYQYGGFRIWLRSLSRKPIS
jgi:SAM-dependent methyltransferase